MTDKQFYTIWTEAVNDGNKEAFVSDWWTSSIFSEDEATANLVGQIEKIWDAAHMTVAEIRAATGLSQGKFAVKYCIPVGTIHNWEQGIRKCPDYIRLLLIERLGLLKR